LQNLYSFFDESGKFADHAVIAFGGLIGGHSQVRNFDLAWGALLREHGMAHFTMKKALRPDLPLGTNIPAIGIEDRTGALMRFLDCAKDHAELIVGCAIDVTAFKSLSSAARTHLGKNPQYAAFARVTMGLISYIQAHEDDGHVLSIICDDEQAAAIPMYKLYGKIKNYYPSIRKMFSSFTLGDDEITSACRRPT
jgi:hypothetical protein